MIQDNQYTNMQKAYYEPQTRVWSPSDRDHIVGSFDAHNQWEDYELLFKDIPDLSEKTVLDFGCGPGRNLVKYASRFKAIDGVDLLEGTLNNARTWIEYNGLDYSKFKLHLCNGYDLSAISDSSYDIVMSTICFQHICVYDIRLNYLKEFFRVLKPGGYLTMQMGFGSPSPNTFGYHENVWGAHTTNRGCDTEVPSTDYLINDLYSIGFKDFVHYLCPPGPGDNHPNWIFFHVQK